MRFVRFLSVVAVGTLAAAAAGCGGGSGGNYAKVSGVVTLDGKPYPNAIVSFQPYAAPGNPNPGRGSSGLTDDNGRFSLTCDDGKDGAVVGKHRIRIRTKVNDPTKIIDPSVGSDDDPGVLTKEKRGEVERVPPEWFDDNNTKEFTVPAGGTDQANFDMITPPPPKKGSKKK